MSSVSSNDVKEQGVSRIGFYDIERTIGKGNFAVVRLARHRITKSYVAVKIINKSKLDEVNLRKMYREIQIMQLINHPQIIKLYQVIETKTMLYLVTEYAENGELFDYISKRGRMSEQNAKTVFAQISSAVKYLHDNKIVHRDLKTENLLFDSHNRVKLADFGFANFFSDNDLLSTWCGSPPYAAPEVFEGLKYHGPEIDIWSLGVILYVLVCGILPFSGDTLQALRDHVLSCHFRVPFFLSTVCEDLIRKMLVRNPVKRFTIADVLRHPWLNGAVCAEWQQPPPVITSDQRDYILRLMQSLGISPARVVQSVESNAFDNYASMYHLLAERFVGRSRRSEGLIRRPSSLAEQAIEQATGSVSASPVNTSPVPQMQMCSTNSSIASTNSGVVIDGFTVKAISSSGFGSSLNDSPIATMTSPVPLDPQHQSAAFVGAGHSTSVSETNNSDNAAGAAAMAILFQAAHAANRVNNDNSSSNNNNNNSISNNNNYNNQSGAQRAIPAFGGYRFSPFGVMPGPNKGGQMSGFAEAAPIGQSGYRGVSAGQPHHHHHQNEQPFPQFSTNNPSMSLQQNHQYLSSSSVPSAAAAAAQSALAALHPFVFMNSHLLPASYYGAFVLQQLHLQQQQQEAAAAAAAMDASGGQNASMNSSESSMDTSLVSVIRPNPLCYRPTSDLPLHPLSIAQLEQVSLASNNNNNNNNYEFSPGGYAGRPPLGPTSYSPSSRRPPLLKRASLPADVGGHSLADVASGNNINQMARSMVSGNNSASSLSFSRPAGSDYSQHVFYPKCRRFHTKLSPYPLPTQIELPSPADHNSQTTPPQQRFVFMPSLSHPGSSSLSGASSGSTAQLQVATELLTIDEQPTAASSSSSSLCAASVRSSRSVDVELLATRNTATTKASTPPVNGDIHESLPNNVK